MRIVNVDKIPAERRNAGDGDLGGGGVGNKGGNGAHREIAIMKRV